MEQRYVCHVKAIKKEKYGEKATMVWAYTVQFIWLDEKSQMYRGVNVHKKRGELDSAHYTNEYVIYTAILDLLGWLITNTSKTDPVSIYTESLKVCNQLGTKRSKLLSSYDYMDLAKTARVLADQYPEVRIHQVPHQSLGVAHMYAVQG